jgi:hypothetical protein
MCAFPWQKEKLKFPVLPLLLFIKLSVVYQAKDVKLGEGGTLGSGKKVISCLFLR